MKKDRLEHLRSELLFHLFTPPKEALTMIEVATGQVEVHRSAQIMSFHLAKEPTAGFAPATIRDVLKANKVFGNERARLLHQADRVLCTFAKHAEKA